MKISDFLWKRLGLRPAKSSTKVRSVATGPLSKIGASSPTVRLNLLSDGLSTARIDLNQTMAFWAEWTSNGTSYRAPNHVMPVRHDVHRSRRSAFGANKTPSHA